MVAERGAVVDTRTPVWVGGLGLVAVNFWTSSQRDAIANLVFGDKQGAAAAQPGHAALVGIGGELVLLLVLFVVAGMSDQLASAMLAIVAALWVLWGITYYTRNQGASANNGKPWQQFNNKPA